MYSTHGVANSGRMAAHNEPSGGAMGFGLSRFLEYWRSTPRLVRIWTVTLAPAGALMLILGILGDQRGFWEGKSFLTNLASSATSLMFGVPVALHVLNHLMEAQTVATARRQWYGRETMVRQELWAHLLALAPGRTAQEIADLSAGFNTLADDLTAGARPTMGEEVARAVQAFRAYSPGLFDPKGLNAAYAADAPWAEGLRVHLSEYKRIRDSGADLGILWSGNWPQTISALESLSHPLGATWIKVHNRDATGMSTLSPYERARFVAELSAWLRAVHILVQNGLPTPRA